MKATIALVSAIVGLSAAADTIAVKTRERGFVTVDDKQTATYSGLITSEPEGKVYKGGEGTLNLPDAAIDATGDIEIDVLAGKVRLMAGGTSSDPAAAAPAILQSAEFWVSPASAVDDGTGRAKLWNDVRESSYDAADENPTHNRRYAEPVWGASGANQDYINWYANNHDGAQPLHGVNPQIVTDGNGQPMGVNFGGVGSTQAMKWNDEVYNIRRLFVVCTATTGWVNPVQSYYDTQLQGYYHNGTFDQPLHTPQTNEAKTPHEDAVVFVNGRRVDPCGTLISSFGDGGKGTYLLEYAFYGVSGAQLGDFYSDRQVDVAGGYPSRFGGDTIHEMAVFTSILTDEEAASVRRYLKAKYGIAKSERTFGVAKDATLEVEAGSESATTLSAGTANRVVLSGSGDVVKSGSGKAVLASDQERPFVGSVTIDGGTLVARSPLAVALSSGDVVSSVAYDPDHIDIGKLGDEITIATNAAPAGRIVKTGNGTVVTRGLDAAVTTVDVREGTFALAAPRGETASLEHAATPSVFVPNHSFEDNRADNDLWYGADALPLTIDGWTFGGGGWCNGFGIFNNTLLQHGWLSNELHAPDGDWAAFFKGRFWMDATVTIPERGRYEISLRAKNRHEGGGGGNPKEESGLEVFIGSDAEHLEHVGYCFPDVHMYQRYRLRTRVLEPGTYVIRIDDSMRDWIDHAQTIDDVRITRIPEGEDPGVWPLPNGDFELAGSNYGGAGAFMALRDPPVNVVSGWTLNPGESVAAENGFAAIQPIPVGFYDNVNPHGDAFNRISGYMDAGYGSVQLSFWGRDNGNTATASLTFTPPAGVWRLRCRARSYRGLNSSRGYNNEDGDMFATITAGETAFDLGKAEIDGVRFARTYWPNSFTSDGETSVTLTLRLEKGAGCAIVDDFELQRAADVELVSNGGLEAGSPNGFPTGWDSYIPAGDVGDIAVAPLRYADGVTRDHFTNDPVEGQWCMRLNQACGIQQTIVVPETGIYRLGYWAQSRHGYGSDETFNWNGRNPVRAALLQNNEIVQTFDVQAVESTNFVEHVAYARIEAGTYRLLLQGTRYADALLGWDHATLVDRISLKVVPEGEFAEVPSLSRNFTLNVSSGAKVRLDFAGTSTVARVTYGGVAYRGIVSAETCTDFVTGPGALDVKPRGIVVIIR